MNEMVSKTILSYLLFLPFLFVGIKINRKNYSRLKDDTISSKGAYRWRKLIAFYIGYGILAVGFLFSRIPFLGINNEVEDNASFVLIMGTLVVAAVYEHFRFKKKI